MAEWKDVRTAPEDELVLVWGEKKGFAVAIYTHAEGWEAETLHGREQMRPPLFWMPLPSPPESQG